MFSFFLAAVTATLIVAFSSVDYAGRSDSTRGANAGLALGKPSRFLARSPRELRDDYNLSRQGLQFGVPKQGIPHAMSQMHVMEHASIAGQADGSSGLANFADAFSRAATATGQWFSIGPQPMLEAGNFTGSPVGSNVAMTGRVTSIAADATGLIAVGTASGGLWVSTNNGLSFASVFDGLPTEAIGAVALDTTTTPSTIYAGTGEGNDSVDSLYGEGIFKSTDAGQTWTALGPAGTFIGGSFTSLAIDTKTTPGSPRIFAGITNGFSGSRAEAGIFETPSNIAGLWFSPNGGNSWSQYPEATFNHCDLIGDGTAPCPADDVVIDPSNPMNVYVAIDTENVYYSNNGGQTFNPAALTGSVPQGRDSLAVGPPQGPPLGASNAPGVVYAMVGAPDGLEYIGFLCLVYRRRDLESRQYTFADHSSVHRERRHYRRSKAQQCLAIVL